MSLNPFATVGTYSEMLNKIATWTFVAALVATALVRARVPQVDTALGVFSFKVPVAGMDFPLGTLLPAFGLAVLSRVAKLHDRLSDLFGIRRRFDRQEILLPMALSVGASLTPDQIEKLETNRRGLMGEVFYRFVSSDKSKSQIDSHYVTMALDQWSWYWVVLEVAFVIALAGVILFAGHDYFDATLAAWMVVLLIAVLQAIRASCVRYARAEIREILKVKDAPDLIRASFRAL
jgi:hypothetical protein